MSEYVKSLYGVLDVQLLINGKEEKWNLAALYKKYNVIIQMWGGIKDNVYIMKTVCRK